MKKLFTAILLLISIVAFSQGKAIDSVLALHTKQLAEIQSGRIIPGVGISVVGNKLIVDQQRTDSLVSVIKLQNATIEALKLRLDKIDLWIKKPL